MEYSDYESFVYDVTSESSRDTGALLKTLHNHVYMNNDDYVPHLLTAALGLSGELGEIIEQEIMVEHDEQKMKAELGDFLWYITQGLFGLDWTFQEMLDNIQNDDKVINEPLSVAVARFADNVKKVTFHGKTLNDKHKPMRDALKRVYIEFDRQYLQRYDIDLVELMVSNQAKLEARHPTGNFNGNY